jgi:CBS domain containing-hemolysin-like protein
MTQDIVIWLAIAFCITQSAIFSGLNLAFFSLSRLQLEVESKLFTFDDFVGKCINKCITNITV